MRAVEVNITIMRAFVAQRGLLASNKDLARKLEELEKKYNAQFKMVFDALRSPTAVSDDRSKRRIGFHQEKHVDKR
jgi:hypothetical protein